MSNKPAPPSPALNVLLRKLREQAGLLRQDLAEQVSPPLTAALIKMLEEGRVSCTPDIFKRLCVALPGLRVCTTPIEDVDIVEDIVPPAVYRERARLEPLHRGRLDLQVGPRNLKVVRDLLLFVHKSDLAEADILHYFS